MSSEKLSVHLYGHIGEDVPAAQAVEVEQDVACMACELKAVVCSRGHAVITCAKVVKGVINMENSTTDPLWAECRKKKQTNKVKIKLHDFIGMNISIIPQIKTWSDRNF